MEQTVVLIKPDGVKRGLIGEIIHRFERMGLKIVAMKMIIPTQEILHEHYGTHKEETIERLGKKTLASYERFGRDAKKELGTDSPKELGKKIGRAHV